MRLETQQHSWKALCVLSILLLLNLPVVASLQLSNIRVENITSNSATIAWSTDEPATSFASYGKIRETLQTIGDAQAVQEHTLKLSNLQPQTDYLFSVRSNDVINDNNGSLYSFMTAAIDREAPAISLNLEDQMRVQGSRVDLEGRAEAGAVVLLTVNSLQAGSMTASPTGMFRFLAVLLRENEWNTIRIDATDVHGNSAALDVQVFADTHTPQITWETPLPTIVSELTLALQGTINEEADFVIVVNGQEEASGSGTTITANIALKEGENTINIELTDKAGLETQEEFIVIADTHVPTVTAEIEGGTEYYQGRAASSIHGTTEAGAEVFLYIFRPLLGSESQPDFTKAIATVAANEKGEFTFDEVDFDNPQLPLEDLAPREVPAGLQELVIYPIAQVAAQQEQSRYLYIIAEDKSGKVSTTPWQATVTLNTCFSGNFAFAVDELTQFHAPFRLNPQLLDDGRETIQAVFNLSYRGKGVAKQDIATGYELEAPFRITNVNFEKACTPGMENDDTFKLGCQILPQSNPRKTANHDKTAWYITYALHSSQELSKAEESYWDEFQKRKVFFPLKVKVDYQERQQDGSYSEVRTVTQCTDLGYYIDIPVDSKDMLPDFIAEEGLESIDWTLEKINVIMPYLKKAILVTGIGCISSFLGRMSIRWARIFTSKMETYSTRLLPAADSKKCPVDQRSYYLASEIEHWKEIWGKIDAEQRTKIRGADGSYLTSPEQLDELKLDDRCPWTAGMWKTEAVLDQAYRWTCDRVFCRTVPAGWTAGAEKQEVDTVIEKQAQCTATGRGLALIKVEKCNELVEKDVTLSTRLSVSEKGEYTCYRLNDRLYTVEGGEYRDEKRIVKLKLVPRIGQDIEAAERDPAIANLFAYRPYGSDQFMVAQDQSCQNACQNPLRPGYTADVQGGVGINSLEFSAVAGPSHAGSAGCYEEVQEGSKITLKGSNGEIAGERYSVGYTQDCFIHPEFENDPLLGSSRIGGGKTGLLQCVCAPDTKTQQRAYFAREALKEQDAVSEDWSYRQAEIYKQDARFGTYYPEWRYYGGRDFSSAFGADYILDYLQPANEKEVHQVSPNTQFLGAYQTMCLSRIRGHLVFLQSILQGLRACIQEAKVTGLHDAGVCKTLFTQHVCGLLYKAIAYFFTQCSPYTPEDPQDSVLGGVGYAFQAGFSSIGEAMDTSITDLKADYGNAVLNEYFATGSQGFAQSLCMAAFGYDWPLGTDFILDSAYAVEGKTVALVVPAERELATFNPATGTAVYNYNVGAMIMPGCKIRSYDVYLKCIGPEDVGRPGVECGPQGCDCSKLRSPSAFEGERVKYLDGGSGFELTPNSFTSMPIEAPQKIDSAFRYDHVVVDLQIDQYSSADKCFDEGYRDGKFYFPITDITPPGVGVCQVHYETGRYMCPEISGLFGGAAGSYLEDPFISCYDDKTNSYVDCSTPNLFTLNDDIKVKVHVYNDGKGQCLKISADGLSPNGVPYEIPQKLPENLPGPYGPVIPLGRVSENLLLGAGNVLQFVPGSTASCSVTPDPVSIGQTVPEGAGSFTFNFQQPSAGSYVLTIPDGVTVENIASYSYEQGSRQLTQKDGSGLSAAEVRALIFNVKGYRVLNLIGEPQGLSGQCTYRFNTYSTASTTSSGYYPQQRQLRVRAQLFEPDAGGQCFDSRIAVKPAGFGKADHTVVVTVQKESVVQQIETKMHQFLKEKNYNAVTTTANEIINRKSRDMEEVIAIYYYVAAIVLQGDVTWEQTKGAQVCALLKVFKEGYPNDVAQTYPEEVQQMGEYQKIATYLREIETNLNKKGVDCAKVLSPNYGER